MKIHKVIVKNFRLLVESEIALEDRATLIVGRNNSGKTSLYEVIRRFLTDEPTKFALQDFSIASYDKFCEALKAKNDNKEDHEIRALIPSIEVRLILRYDPLQTDLGPLSEFVVDLDPDCNEAMVIASYQLREGAIEELFAGYSNPNLNDESRRSFFKDLRDRVPTLFRASLRAEDPNDSNNQKEMNIGNLSLLLETDFINAQRGLDDNTSKESDVLMKILESLYVSAKASTSEQIEQSTAQALEETVDKLQNTIEGDFREELQKLVPTLKFFGYPGLDGPNMETETILDIRSLISSHTKMRYEGHHGILFPETYNGLGIRNLIFVLFQIVNFYRKFRAEQSAPGVHLVFIEEPEAHLHPQMQEVFIRQISMLAEQLSNKDEDTLPWPVQFVISTHSSHVANAAKFESIRYFLPYKKDEIRQTKIKDLRMGLRDTRTDHIKFLSQYLTLTRCDLFFADKAILVEGTTERLLLPVIIQKLERDDRITTNLSNQYISTLEVGGAYAHIFFDLLDFLEIPTLIITDLDSVNENGVACPVHEGVKTSNACLMAWFEGESSLEKLVNKDYASKIQGRRRIAFQCPNVVDGVCGRTFEDEFMLSNPVLFDLEKGTSINKSSSAWDKARSIKKSVFALKYAIDKTDWNTPEYLLEGLRWLSSDGVPNQNEEAGAGSNG